MNERKKKLDLKPGQKYRGYGILNEYGEFEFIPENTGSRQGVKKILKTGLNYTVSTTTNLFIAHITVPKQDDRLKMMNKYLRIVNETLKIIRDYEI